MPIIGTSQAHEEHCSACRDSVSSARMRAGVKCQHWPDANIHWHWASTTDDATLVDLYGVLLDGNVSQELLTNLDESRHRQMAFVKRILQLSNGIVQFLDFTHQPAIYKHRQNHRWNMLTDGNNYTKYDFTASCWLLTNSFARRNVEFPPLFSTRQMRIVSHLSPWPDDVTDWVICQLKNIGTKIPNCSWRLEDGSHLTFDFSYDVIVKTQFTAVIIDDKLTDVIWKRQENTFVYAKMHVLL